MSLVVAAAAVDVHRLRSVAGVAVDVADVVVVGYVAVDGVADADAVAGADGYVDHVVADYENPDRLLSDPTISATLRKLSKW